MDVNTALWWGLTGVAAGAALYGAARAVARRRRAERECAIPEGPAPARDGEAEATADVEPEAPSPPHPPRVSSSEEMVLATVEPRTRPAWFRAAAASHPGLLRAENQDRFLILQQPSGRLVLLAVADGMGGHTGGALAAELTMGELRAWMEEGFSDDWEERHEVLTLLLRNGHREILERARRDESLKGMGTTVVLAMVSFSGRCLHLYAGDSPLYHFRVGERLYRTRDHTLAQAMVEAGQIPPERVRDHPMRSRLTSCLGGGISEERLEVAPPWVQGADYRHQPSLLQLGPDDLLLLCSDGFNQEVGEEGVERLVQAHFRDPEKLVRRCVEAALEAGGKDNITVVAMRLMPR